MSRARLVVPLAALVALGVAAVPANATLVYQRGALKPSVFVANDDGTGARKLLSNAGAPRISPDGQMVAALRLSRSGTTSVLLVPAAGGSARTAFTDAGTDGGFVGNPTWAPDSTKLALPGGKGLQVIDAATATATRVATGSISGVSFSPASDLIAYDRAGRSHTELPPVDIYTVPASGGGGATRLTTDGVSTAPLWGPSAIAFSHLKNTKLGPTAQMWLMNPDGSNPHALTNVKVPKLLYGLTPVDWSASGAQLLAIYGGQDSLGTYTVDPASGQTGKILGGISETGADPFRLSRDGTTILAAVGGPDPSGAHDIVTVPYAGGSATVLVHKAFFADWNR